MDLHEHSAIERWETGHVLLWPGTVAELAYGVSGGLAIYQGDIVLGTADELAGSSPDKPHSVRPLAGGGSGMNIEADMIVGMGFKWPRNIIPYLIDPALADPARVTAAIAHWTANTPVKFVPRTTETDYIRFQKDPAAPDSCHSRIGKVGGMQMIAIADWCLAGGIIHEIGHAFGLWHEQSRVDRNTYATIDLANIDPRYNGAEHNFDMVPIYRGSSQGGYDYGSIMHYSADAFAKPGTRTIIPKDPTAQIGQRTGLSAGDIAAIKERCLDHVTLRNAFDDCAMQLGDDAMIVEQPYDPGNMRQTWRLKPTGQGSYLIVSAETAQALQCPLDGSLWVRSVPPNVVDSGQHWTIADAGSGRLRVVNPRSHRVLAVTGGMGNPDGRHIEAKTPDQWGDGLVSQWYYGATA